jgi:hypothetical protein
MLVTRLVGEMKPRLAAEVEDPRRTLIPHLRGYLEHASTHFFPWITRLCRFEESRVPSETLD